MEQVIIPVKEVRLDLFEDALESGRCEECEHCNKSSEPYEFWGARGSRDVLECVGDEDNCPLVEEKIKAAIQDWIDDNIDEDEQKAVMPQ